MVRPTLARVAGGPGVRGALGVRGVLVRRVLVLGVLVLGVLARRVLVLGVLVVGGGGAVHGGGELVLVVLPVQLGVMRHALLHHAELLVAVASLRIRVTETETTHHNLELINFISS